MDNRKKFNVIFSNNPIALEPMLVKVFWLCGSVSVEVYAIKKKRDMIVGFSYPMRIKGHDFTPHWTYHAGKKRKPHLHHISRSGKTLKFMTLEEPYFKSFESFLGVFWTAPNFGAPFDLISSTTNVSGHPEKEDKKVSFSLPKEHLSWTHYLRILLLERNKPDLVDGCLTKLSQGYFVISHELIDDGYQPNILLVFLRNRDDLKL